MATVYSAQALAYLGDAVIEVWVRERLVRSGLSGSRELNAEALSYVTAPRQAAAMKKILPALSEDEAAIFRRGRNIGHTNLPRHATASEYRSATGMEALMGWLYLGGRQDRINELLTAAYNENV
ncbi:MAG: ribonuclease III [Clostridia bacterium]|nr:ribonuclease III [Clostridia bacterium]